MAILTMMQREILKMNLEQHLNDMTAKMFQKSIGECSDQELYYALLMVTKDFAKMTDQNDGEKMIYYISAEFLIGKLLSNNLMNIGIYEQVDELLQSYGKSLSRLEDIEPEPSLGNGGLGRLAACFMDSIATLGYPGAGIGLNYHYGLFKQRFAEHQQMPEKDPWMEDYSWLTKTKVSFDVKFGKRVVKSRLYDVDVLGYKNGRNKLHLFDVETIDESIVKEGINFDQQQIEKNLTLFLYPDDSTEDGRMLRLYQQYFMVSNAAQLIRYEMREHQYDMHELYEHAVIQINDTHPTLIIPELIRILVKEEAFSMDEAIQVVTKTCAYTNHTILAEALEKWPMHYLEKVVPQLVPIIKELDKRAKKKYPQEEVAIISKDNIVHMAHIDIHYGFSVNGVAAIHTEILKNAELNHFYEIYPEKFNNKTNGITFRRWLTGCNKPLTSYLENLIGHGFKLDAKLLERLLQYKDDSTVLEELAKIKKENKCRLAEYIKIHEGIEIDPESIFDIQIKRMHEYKRQQMNALYIIHKYLEIRSGKVPKRPITFIFGAKAAPAYVIAQDIIHLLLVLQDIVNHDQMANKYIRIVFVTNYNVTYAEKLIPACDISEQISLASKEASGTGNMKFMLNGAVTLGTDDGANVEIHDLVGNENIYIFGAKSSDVIEHYKKGDYKPKKYYRDNEMIQEAVDFITGKLAFAHGNKERLIRLKNELLEKDYFMTLLDFPNYVKRKDGMLNDYEDRKKWNRKMLVNIAKAGFFSSDRTIAEYNKDIWKLKLADHPKITSVPMDFF